MTNLSFYWQISESRMRYTGQHHLMSDFGRRLWYTVFDHERL